VFDDGVARPMNGSPSRLYEVTRVAVGPPGYIYGYDNGSSAFTLTVYSVDTTGTTFLSATQGLIDGFEGFLLYDRNSLFSYHGEVIDVSSPTQPVRAGQFAYAGEVAVRDASEVFMLTDEVLPFTLRRLDRATFTQIAAVELPAGVLAATSLFNNLVYVGGDELVFLTYGDNNAHNVCVAHVPPLVATP
jgi:hypothetical protein